jgi:hypothetical protein
MKAPKLVSTTSSLASSSFGQLLGKIGVDALELAGLGIAVGDRIVERELADAQLVALGDLEQARLRLLRVGRQAASTDSEAGPPSREREPELPSHP